MASTQTEDPAKPALGSVLDTPTIPSSGNTEGGDIPEVSPPITQPAAPQPVAPQPEEIKDEPESKEEGGLLSTLMDSIRSATGVTQEPEKEPTPSAPEDSVVEDTQVPVESVPPSAPQEVPAAPSAPPSMPTTAPPSAPPSMPTTAPPSAPPSMPTTSAQPPISMITPPTFMRPEQPESSLDTTYQTPQDTSTFLPITQQPAQEPSITSYGTFPPTTQPSTQPSAQQPLVSLYQTPPTQPSIFGQLPSLDASQPRPGDVVTPPALEPTQFSFLDETPQPMPFEPEEDELEEIEEPDYEESVEEEESDDEEESDEEEEPEEPTTATKPSPAIDDVLLTAAMDKVARGEIFEGDTPFFQPYDILPWWGWAIVFFLLGIAFITVVYFLFYQPTEPTPAPQPPTPVAPIPAPDQPQPVPPPDSSRKMYCLIGEDQGRKVVIRVSDPSLCRRTVLLTDEEYENSL